MKFFDIVTHDNSETNIHLSSTDKIVHSPIFESAAVKARVDVHSMNGEAVASVRFFEFAAETEPLGNNVTTSCAERAVSRRLTGSQSIVLEYVDLRFLLPASKFCE